MFIAHKAEDGREEPIRDHLEAVAKKATEFAKPFGASDWAYNMGYLHDVGKYSDDFQRRIKEDGPRVDHSSAGAYVMSGSEIGYLLSYCIAGHHGGLPDAGPSGTLDRRFKKVKKEDHSWYDRMLKDNPCLIGEPSQPLFLRNEDHSLFSTSSWIRMMFSCLTDADFLATEEFMQDHLRLAPPSATIEELRDRLEEELKAYYPPKGHLNELRCEVLDVCRKAAQGKPGFYSLTVPTGGGKTLASMRFALNHLIANEHEEGRVIYAIPYTSIIEQNAEVFREKLGKANILEHHSNFDFESQEERVDSAINDEEAILTDALRLATENWDMPVVVTTNVQLFESLYSSKPSRCRKLHNLANSVIVLDEAQMLPIQQLKPCLAALKELVQNYGCTVVFCTATQPALKGILDDIPEIVEICSFKGRLFDELKRVDYQYIGTVGDAELASRLSECDQVLCIVNSRKQAQNIYRDMKAIESEGIFHLSTFMYPVHRAKTIKTIKQQLNHGLSCKVISTSLVEAGVDLDFPIVYRAMAGLDSVVQAAGRCNREGKKAAESSMVYVFESETNYGVPPEVEQKAEMAKVALRNKGIALDEINAETSIDMGNTDVITSYFKVLYELRAQGMDKSGAYDGMSNNEENAFPFKSVGERFKMIEEGGKPVVIPVEEIVDDIAALRRGSADRETIRRLGRYSVNAYPKVVANLVTHGAVECVADDVYILMDASRYSDEYGLDIGERFGEGVMW